MKIKKISAPTMAEAMQIVKQEMGEDAVILNSKTVESGGVFGLFKRKLVEVIAALDEPKVKEGSIHTDHIEKQALNELSTYWRDSDAPKVDDVKRSRMVQTAKPIISEPKKEQWITKKELSDQLMNQELDEPLIEKILKNYEHVSIENKEDVYDLLSFNLKNIFRDIDFGGISFTKKFVNVLGPTGVGKTTTLAKLAAKCVLDEEKKVAFITTDTYRIAAIEQLKTYAQILSVPLEVCYNAQDFIAAKNKFSDYDVVFIDSAGRNFLDQENVLNLTKIINYDDDDVEVFLVFALTGKYLDMKKIYKQFSKLPIYRFIFTKIDETHSYGAMFNLMDEFKVGTAYITNGQNVPDDFVDADLFYLINLFIEGCKYERSS